MGWDMTAALAMADALGLNRLIAAELLPLIEPFAVKVYVNIKHVESLKSDEGHRKLTE